jgi:hypothetical protein
MNISTAGKSRLLALHGEGSQVHTATVRGKTTRRLDGPHNRYMDMAAKRKNLPFLGIEPRSYNLHPANHFTCQATPES